MRFILWNIASKKMSNLQLASTVFIGNDNEARHKNETPEPPKIMTLCLRFGNHFAFRSKTDFERVSDANDCKIADTVILFPDSSLKKLNSLDKSKFCNFSVAVIMIHFITSLQCDLTSVWKSRLINFKVAQIGEKVAQKVLQNKNFLSNCNKSVGLEMFLDYSSRVVIKNNNVFIRLVIGHLGWGSSSWLISYGQKSFAVLVPGTTCWAWIVTDALNLLQGLW